MLDAISQQEADIKYSVQSGSLEAERVRDENLTASAAAFEDFNRRVGESQNRFAELEASAHKVFGGYSKLLAPDREWPQPDLSGDENQLFEELNRLEKKVGDDLVRFRGLFPVAILTYVKGRSQGSALAQEIAGNLAKSRWLIPACFEKAKTHGQQEQVRLRNETADAIAAMNQRWKQSVKDAIELRGSRPIKVDAKAHRASRRTRRLVTRA